MAAHPKVRFKAEHIWQAPDDDKRYEVIDGDLFVTPAPSWSHQRVVHKLDFLLSSWIFAHNLGEITEAPTGVVLDPETGVEPDLLYIARERVDIISQRGVEGPPDLVVEVLSPSTEARDRGIKMARYAAAGIAHYWLVNVEAQTLEAYELGERGYEPGGAYGRGAAFEPKLFPGLRIAIDDLWT